MFFNKIKAGFSLIEVNMAILIAAGGMLSLFALFPVGLRQSVMSEADLHQAAFASSFFEAVTANTEKIDDVRDWNDVKKFWAAAIKGTGLDSGTTLTLLDPAGVKAKVAESTGELIGNAPKPEKPNDPPDELNTEAKNLRYVYRETDKEDSSFSGTKLKLPPQMLIRIRTINNSSGRSPNGYAISLVSSHEFTPAIYSHNTVYSMELYFKKRP